jgi:hypothetical protein
VHMEVHSEREHKGAVEGGTRIRSSRVSSRACPPPSLTPTAHSSTQNDGEWGDNVELQAMSEIYHRHIEIYAYSHGTFIEGCPCRCAETMSLAFGTRQH